MTISRVFFYCCPYTSPEKAAYQHLVVSLAEGFQALGIECYADQDYWLTDSQEGFLLQADAGIKPQDCDVVVMNDAWFSYGHPWPENLFVPNRPYLTVYLDQADGFKTLSWQQEFQRFDFIFKTHYNHHYRYPKTVHPWAFGLTDRILKATDAIPAFADRRRSILFNARISHPLRQRIEETFVPLVKTVLEIDRAVDSYSLTPMTDEHQLQWAQTGRRHYPDYYDRLAKTSACSCFGGYFASRLPGPMGMIMTRISQRLGRQSSILLQWDSWRFWEAMAAGCVAFHVDFTQYGLTLPAMPINWQHYIGIDLKHPEATVDKIIQDPTCLERISEAGRAWVREQYNPEAIARRFLQTLKELKGSL